MDEKTRLLKELDAARDAMRKVVERIPPTYEI
jgi:hypothetical protein